MFAQRESRPTGKANRSGVLGPSQYSGGRRGEAARPPRLETARRLPHCWRPPLRQPRQQLPAGANHAPRCHNNGLVRGGLALCQQRRIRAIELQPPTRRQQRSSASGRGGPLKRGRQAHAPVRRGGGRSGTKRGACLEASRRGVRGFARAEPAQFKAGRLCWAALLRSGGPPSAPRAHRRAKAQL